MENIFIGSDKTGQKQSFLQAATFGMLVETEKQAIDREFIRRVDALLEENLMAGNYAVGELSLDMAMSPTKFRIEIRKNTGVPPLKYMLAFKMKKAKQYLELRLKSITDVAYEVGFSDERYFRKQFKKYYHQSPTEYIENLKG